MGNVGTRYWRRILASSAVYAAAGWAVVEALTTVVDRFGLPTSLATLITALYVAGLPVTVFLVWRTAGTERRLDFASSAGALIFLALATAIVFWGTRPTPEAPPNLVAIVPCEFSGRDDYAYRSESLAEEVHARIALVDDVKVSSWNSSVFVRDKGYSPVQIGEVLGVDRLVQCRVTSGSERIELSAQLLDPATGRVLWTRDYDFGVSDLGTVITELAGNLLDVLGTRVEAAELERVNDVGTFSPEAYDLYLQASVEGDVERADALLVRALEIDPNFPDALVSRAGLFLRRAVSGDFDSMEEPREWLHQTRLLATRAIEIDHDVMDARRWLVEVCGLLGNYFDEHCDAGEAGRLMREECEVRGSTAEGWACWSQVLESPDNLAALERWLELEPTSSIANMQYMGVLRERDGDFAEVLAVFDTLRALDPNDRRPYGMISNMLRRDGRLDEVLAWRFGVTDDRMPADSPWQLERLSTDYMNLGLYEEAKEPGVLTWETRPSSAIHFIPVLWARLGESKRAEEALDWHVSTITDEGASPRILLVAADGYAAVLGGYEQARSLYDRALAIQDLETLCEGEPGCVAWQALLLCHVESALQNDNAAREWLSVAIAAIDVERAERPTGAPSSVSDALLLIAEDQYDAAIDMLREIALGWSSDQRQELELPIYYLESAALFDPLREIPEFQILIDDYNNYLEPMRDQVLEARRSGDWESLRQRTYRWAEQSAENTPRQTTASSNQGD